MSRSKIFSANFSSSDAWPRNRRAQDRPRVLEAIKARTDVPYELEYRIIRPDGSVRWISDRSFPIRSQAGDIYRFGGIACDITRRKQTEEQLATHQAQLEEAQALARLGS